MGTFRVQRYLGVLLVSALAAGMAPAQVLTGTLIVKVRDEQGLAVTGARVRVSSPALIRGLPNLQTNEIGELWLPGLAPGSYSVEVESPGFTRSQTEDVRVGAGARFQQSVVLKVGAAAATVVEVSSPRAHTLESGLESRVGQDYLQRIPATRNSMFTALRAVAGVSPTSPSSSTVNTVSVFGAGVNENAYLVDETNHTCACQGTSRAEPMLDAIQEIQVQSVGASAEFGNIQGAVINVVTRHGGNRFTADASYYGQFSDLTSQPTRLRVPGSSELSAYERIKYRDATFNAGGPIRKDRIWFFTGYEHLRDYDSQPGADPRFPRTYEQDKVFGKLTWQLTPRLRLVQSFHEEFWVNPQIPTLVNPFEATQRLHARVPAITFAHLTHTLSNSTIWDIRVGRFDYRRKDDPSSGSLATPNRSDRVTRVNSGAPQQIGNLTVLRTTAKATMSHYRSGWLGANHIFKAGLEIEQGEHQQVQIIPTGTRYVDDGSQPFQSISRDPSIVGGRLKTAGLFVTDAITIGDRFTINAGVRFDHSRAISPDLRKVDLQGRETEDIVRGLGTLYKWNVVSPRLGVTTRLTGDGRTVLRASYGRFNQGVLTGEVSQNHPGLTPLTTMAFNPADGGYTTPVSVVDSKINLLIDPKTRTPHTDEYSIGVDREVTGTLSVTLAYIHKRGKEFNGWTDVGGQYRDEERTMPDGRSVPVRVLTNSTSARRFLLTNPDGYDLTYNGLVIAAEKRLSRGWMAGGSYTYSRTYGLQSASGATAGGTQLSTVANATAITFGQDPNDLTYARGRLPNDRPHIYRAYGSTAVPWTGLTIAGNFQHFSGKPWASSAQIVLPQGDRRIFLEPRGSRRLSSQSLLDLRLSKTILSRETARLELLVDVFNVLNDTAEEEIASDNFYAANFGQATVFVDPRRAMFGVRLQLGPR